MAQWAQSSSVAAAVPRAPTAPCGCHAERASMLAARAAKLVALRRSKPAERKIAIVLFNFPPNAGATGTAAFLGVFESLFNTLKAMTRRRLQRRGSRNG